jgi:hypothetical protein
MMTNAIFMRSVGSHRKIEIIDCVKIPPISKSHKLQYGTYDISGTLGIPDIRYLEHRAGL